MVRLQLMRMSSYAKNKVQMCSVTQHHCRRRQLNVGDVFSKFTQSTHFLPDTKNDLTWLNNLFTVRLQLIRMSSYARTNYRCVQSPNISVDVAKCVHKKHHSELKHHEFVHVRQVTFSVTKKVSVSGWICENFPNHYGDVYTNVGWLNTSVVVVLSIKTS